MRTQKHQRAASGLADDCSQGNSTDVDGLLFHLPASSVQFVHYRNPCGVVRLRAHGRGPSAASEATLARARCPSKPWTTAVGAGAGVGVCVGLPSISGRGVDVTVGSALAVTQIPSPNLEDPEKGCQEQRHEQQLKPVFADPLGKAVCCLWHGVSGCKWQVAGCRSEASFATSSLRPATCNLPPVTPHCDYETPA